MSKACWCCTDSIGTCSRCGIAVCGDHSQLRGKRICSKCIARSDALAARDEAERAAEAERRDRELAEKMAAEGRQEHAEAVRENREQYGPEEPIRRRIADLERRRSRLASRAHDRPGFPSLLFLAFCGYLAAMAIAGLVGVVILDLSDDTVNALMPMIVAAGVGAGGAIWAAWVALCNAARRESPHLDALIIPEVAKLGCGGSSCGFCDR